MLDIADPDGTVSWSYHYTGPMGSFTGIQTATANTSARTPSRGLDDAVSSVLRGVPCLEIPDIAEGDEFTDVIAALA
jgi:hypothetical protein